MQITSRFSIAVHVLACTEYFKDSAKVTSSFLAGSIGVNPVIIRNVMRQLKDAGLIAISQGKSGISLARPVEAITFFDVYKAVESIGGTGLFRFHESPNPLCPVGRNIHEAMGAKLDRIQKSMEDEMQKITVADVTKEIFEKEKKKR